MKINIENWEKDFDKEFPELVTLSDQTTYKNVCDRTKVRSFVSSVLQAQREQIRGEIQETFDEVIDNLHIRCDNVGVLKSTQVKHLVLALPSLNNKEQL